MKMRIATFNLESLDERTEHGVGLEARAAALRPILASLHADVLCLQEVNAQDARGTRTLSALATLLAGTRYEKYTLAHTGHADGRPRDVHNIVTLSRVPFAKVRQVRHDLIAPPLVRECTAIPAPRDAGEVTWDRPILHTVLEGIGAKRVHLLNLHLRAPLPTVIRGQKESAFRWSSASAWAEGFYVSSIKRNGQALEARVVVDELFDIEPDARIIVCGDLNAGEHEVPLAILRAKADDTGNPALASRVLHDVEAAVPAERRFSVRHAGRPMLLDHILVSESVQACVRSIDILNGDLADEVVDAEKPLAGSFHAPVVAEFEL
jgi:endonuclease/exonuclease/phosphatase family metal-dependent hydrolase